jgi:hypothetical protein
VLEGVEQEGRGLLQHVALQEQVRHGRHVDLGPVLLVDKHLGEAHGPLGVEHGHVGQDACPLGLVAHALGVGEDLVVLLLLHKARDHLAVAVGLVVDFERKCGVGLLDEVAEVLRALELPLVKPLLQQRALALLQHRARQLYGLHRVQRRVFQDLTEVYEQRVLRAGVAVRRRLELVDGVGRAQDAVGRLYIYTYIYMLDVYVYIHTLSLYTHIHMYMYIYTCIYHVIPWRP